jgi:hypothetical protein
MLEKYSLFGTNKYGQKKIYKLERFQQPITKTYVYLLYIVGFNLGYLGLAAYYNKLKHDIWIDKYGEYVPTYFTLGNFTVRTFSILLSFNPPKFSTKNYLLFDVLEIDIYLSF